MRFRSLPSRISGTIHAPPSKSLTHRAIVLAALSTGPSQVGRPLRSEDTDATLDGMAAFGTKFEWDAKDLHVVPSPLRPASGPIEARNSGTTLRFLTAVASLIDAPTTLTGDSSLLRRPMGPLLGALRALGAGAKALGPEGRPPVEVHGVLRGGTASLPGDVSSQFLSSLLLACPLVKGPSEIHVEPPMRSSPYVDTTCQMIRESGGRITNSDGIFRVEGGQSYRPVDREIPGDFSSAAFPLVAAAITGGIVTVTGLDLEAPQGDRRIVGLLRSFGAQVDASGKSVRVQGAPLTGQIVDVGDIPDLFPILVVLASQAKGETRFVNGAHLRYKESDRIEATVAMLRSLGGQAKETADGCIVSGPTRLLGGSVDARGDHRILMAAAVAGLVARGVTDISDSWCFRASYPSFLEDMRALGALHAVVA